MWETLCGYFTSKVTVSCVCWAARCRKPKHSMEGSSLNIVHYNNEDGTETKIHWLIIRISFIWQNLFPKIQKLNFCLHYPIFVQSFPDLHSGDSVPDLPVSVPDGPAELEAVRESLAPCKLSHREESVLLGVKDLTLLPQRLRVGDSRLEKDVPGGPAHHLLPVPVSIGGVSAVPGMTEISSSSSVSLPMKNLSALRHWHWMQRRSVSGLLPLKLNISLQVSQCPQWFLRVAGIWKCSRMISLLHLL